MWQGYRFDVFIVFNDQSFTYAYVQAVATAWLKDRG